MQVHARATTYMATKTFIKQQSWKTKTQWPYSHNTCFSTFKGGQGIFRVSKRRITWKVSNKALSHQHNANI
jgi:hypothetical protein